MAQTSMDAFKDRLAEAQAATGRPELGHQSVGRPITEAEAALAHAMMEIYAEGATDMDAVAARLTERGIAAPGSGKTEWDAAMLEAELRAANASLDAAYLENGYGA